jgi:Protein of unknown function (DUF402)
VAPRFRAGDTILERHAFDGAVTIARPVTVVECDEERLVTWLSPGTEVAFPLERVPPYTGTTVRSWRPPGLLQLVRASDPYALALLHSRRGRFAGWYVNLQEPLIWMEWGYQTRDNLLDLFRPVGGEWQWKDEDELAAAVAAGALTGDDATAIRAAAEQALRDVELPTGWEEWEPEPPLPALRLPPGWAEVRP